MVSNFVTEFTSYIIVFTMGYVCSYATRQYLDNRLKASNVSRVNGSNEPVTSTEYLATPVKNRIFKPFSFGLLSKEEKAFVPFEDDDTIEKKVERMNYNVRD